MNKHLQQTAIFLFFSFVTATGFAQTPAWTVSGSNLNLTPTTASLGLGASSSTFSKLRIDNTLATAGTLYGLYTTTNNTYSGYGNAYGIFSTSTLGANNTGVCYGISNTATNNNTSSTTVTYGISTAVTSYNAGVIYGNATVVENYNTSTTLSTYGVLSEIRTNASNNNTVYGVYSKVTGGNKRWAGYFTGGDMYVSDNIGIGTTAPAAKLDVAADSENAIRIGKLGYRGNINVPLGALASQFNIDFTGYRDVNTNQVGARIAALRFNGYVANSALIQKTGLAFYTNPSGYNGGTTDLQERMRITPEGNIGIGITNPTVKLDVAGVVRAHEVKVCLSQGCDYVFEENYNLMSLSDLSTFVKTKKHLPEVAPAAVMESEGINVSEMNALLLKKVEELTLYIIQQQEMIQTLNVKVEKLENQ